MMTPALTETLMRVALYPAALLAATASCWLILRPLLRKGAAETSDAASKPSALTGDQITARLRRRR